MFQTNKIKLITTTLAALVAAIFVPTSSSAVATGLAPVRATYNVQVIATYRTTAFKVCHTTTTNNMCQGTLPVGTYLISAPGCSGTIAVIRKTTIGVHVMDTVLSC